jgi:cellulose synthase/poly-beta-1,6-N-acetylglucosamine synthase-like glycosyltransferase
VIAVVFETVQWCCLVYMAAINLGSIVLSAISFIVLGRYTQRHSGDVPRVYSEFEPPVSVIVPAYNEASTVVTAVRSLLQLRYPQFELIVINDGSTDETLSALKEAFNLRQFPEALRVRLSTGRVRGMYRSQSYPDLRVIDKENGGKADATNAGINAARYPLFCALDADGILQPDSLRRAVRPFLEDSRTVASGGVVRVANGCDVVGGWLMRPGVPRHPLAMLQVVEYCRAFLFGRLGWNSLNSVLLISGAFGVFQKELVIEAGGYGVGLAGEDMELVMRLHRRLRESRTPYRITFVPDPVCWTEAPESLRVLRRQRVRWQRGLCESLTLHSSLLCGSRGGFLGWVAFPFALIFECLSPIVEIVGYIVFFTGCFAGYVDAVPAIGFLIASIGLGILLSAGSLLLDEMAYHTYTSPRQLLGLLVASICENFGYRQLNLVWRLEGLIGWFVGSRLKWGEMTRTADWSTDLTALARPAERR